MARKRAAATRPRVLFVTDRVPGRTAGNEFRVSNAIDGLLQVGEVHVCLIDSSAEGAPFPDDSRFARSVVAAAELPRWLRVFESIWTIPHLRYGYESALREKVLSAVGSTEWDLIWFSRARVHRLCGPLFDGPHILDLDDLNDRLLTTVAADRARWRGVGAMPRGLLDRITARRWRRRYQALEQIVDRLIVCHRDDADHLGSARAAVVPNGYPDNVPTPSAPPGSKTILFVGPISYEPNYLAVRWFVDHVLDVVRTAVPDASLSVVGAKRSPDQSLGHPAVVEHGWVPDVTPHYETAAITVAPVHSGGGTRIKILETMARKRAMVATSFAVDGLALEPDSGLLIANDPAAFANACIQLLTDGEFAVAQANRAHRAFRDGHGASRSIAAVANVAGTVLAETSADNTSVAQ